MEFYNSLSQDEFDDFQQDMGFTMRAASDVIRISKQVEDPAFAKEMEDLLGKHLTGTQQNNRLLN